MPGTLKRERSSSPTLSELGERPWPEPLPPAQRPRLLSPDGGWEFVDDHGNAFYDLELPSPTEETEVDTEGSLVDFIVHDSDSETDRTYVPSDLGSDTSSTFVEPSFVEPTEESRTSEELVRDNEPEQQYPPHEPFRFFARRLGGNGWSRPEEVRHPAGTRSHDWATSLAICPGVNPEDPTVLAWSFGENPLGEDARNVGAERVLLHEDGEPCVGCSPPPAPEEPQPDSDAPSLARDTPDFSLW